MKKTAEEFSQAYEDLEADIKTAILEELKEDQLEFEGLVVLEVRPTKRIMGIRTYPGRVALLTRERGIMQELSLHNDQLTLKDYINILEQLQNVHA